MFLNISHWISLGLVLVADGIMEGIMGFSAYE